MGQMQVYVTSLDQETWSTWMSLAAVFMLYDSMGRPSSPFTQMQGGRKNSKTQPGPAKLD